MKVNVRSVMYAGLVIAATASAVPMQPEASTVIQPKNDRAVVGSPEQFRKRARIPKSLPHNQSSLVRHTRAAEIDPATLATMAIPAVLQEIDQVENPWEFSPFFSWNSGTEAFYSDSTRMIELIDSLEARFTAATKDDSKNVVQLVEVIRAGFYLGWSNDEVAYLNSNGFFIRRTGAAQDAAVNNPSFGFETAEQVKLVDALGSIAGSGYTTPHMANSSAKIFSYYLDNLSLMNSDRSYGDALYSLGTGIAFAISARDMYNLKWETHRGDSLYYTYSPFWLQVDDLYDELERGSLMQEIYTEQEWLTNNYAYWLGTIGLAVKRPRPQKALETFIDTYGKWTEVSLTALDNLDYYYDGEWSDGTVIEMESIKEEVHDTYLPNTYRFENGSVIFKTGSDVDPDKLKKLVWAMREVRSQFYRYVGSDQPLEQGNQDDSLIAIIYNTPDEYEMNSFLYDVSTDNGGLYIESWGTFFTYERTPQESIYTLEDLFRHEFTHYLQGRYITPGTWNYSDQVKYHIIWWDEGGAEYTAGSSRDNGITIRKAMVGNIDRDDRLTINETVRSTYDDGFGFYTYSFVLFSYLHRHNPEKIQDLITLLKANDLQGFSDACEAMGADQQLEQAYQNWMDSLKAEYNSFDDPITPASYLQELGAYSADQIKSDIISTTPLNSCEVTLTDDETFPSFTAIGNLPQLSSWTANDKMVTQMIQNLSHNSWSGYQTASAYFTETEGDSVQVTIYGRSSTQATDVESFVQLKKGISAYYTADKLQLSVPHSGQFTLAIYGANGQIIHKREMTLRKGVNPFSLKDFNLSAGVKFLSLSSGKSRFVTPISLK